jgi:DNA-binding phage protein
MRKAKTTRYDVAEHLQTPKEMAAYLEACIEEAGDDPLSLGPSAIARAPAA